MSSPDHAEEASPVYNTSGNRTSFFLAIGENDFSTLRAQHAAMLKALQQHPGAVKTMERQGHDHFNISLDHGDAGNPWSRKVREWMA